MASAVCPHCGATNEIAGDFCTACGFAMPAIAPQAPRIVGAKGTATTAAGQKLQSGELLNTTKMAARSLLSIGVINLVFGAMYASSIYAAVGGQLNSNSLARVSPWFMASMLSMVISGALYLLMYWWANYNPLAATVVGLIVYLLRWGVDLFLQNTLQHSGSSNQSSNYGYVRIFMVVYLIRGVAAGWKHRQLEKQQQLGSQPIRAIPIE